MGISEALLRKSIAAAQKKGYVIASGAFIRRVNNPCEPDECCPIGAVMLASNIVRVPSDGSLAISLGISYGWIGSFLNGFDDDLEYIYDTPDHCKEAYLLGRKFRKEFLDDSVLP